MAVTTACTSLGARSFGVDWERVLREFCFFILSFFLWNLSLVVNSLGFRLGVFSLLTWHERMCAAIVHRFQELILFSLLSSHGFVSFLPIVDWRSWIYFHVESWERVIAGLALHRFFRSQSLFFGVLFLFGVLCCLSSSRVFVSLADFSLLWGFIWCRFVRCGGFFPILSTLSPCTWYRRRPFFVYLFSVCGLRRKG